MAQDGVDWLLAMINLLGLILTAYASHYSDGVMRDVLYNRQNGNAWVSLPLELPAHDGLIAVRDCHHLGEIWTIRPVGAPDWERHLVIDCARPARYDDTRAWMARHHIMVEVSYSTAKRWDGVGQWTAIERLFGLEDLRR
jgi:hypothetical protein